MSNLVINANSIYDRIIRIGRQTENLVSSITFNVNMWIKEYGQGECVLNVKRNGDGSAYPVPMTITDGLTTWTIKDTDTAKNGRGEIQLFYTVGEKVKTSPIFIISCDKSLVGEGEPPSGYDDWYTELVRMTAEVEAAKTSASTSATNASASATASATSASESAESATASANSASEASQSATSANDSAQSAGASATTAQNASTSASQSASNASTSASQASASATSAQTSATQASESATSASASASSASASAESASASAESATNAVLNAFPMDTASGAVASFPDGAALPLKSLVIDINPVQDTSQGDPSPTNICPISGWTGMNVQHTGANIWDEEWESGDYVTTVGRGNKRANAARIRCKNFIEVKPGEALYCLSPTTKGNFVILFYDEDKVYGRGDDRYITAGNSVITVPSWAYYMTFYLVKTTYDNDISINYPSTDHGYHPYMGQSIPISWQSEAGTVYGGVLDVLTGVLTVTDANIASYNGETLPGEWISDRDVYSAGAMPTTGAQVVYKLSEPIEIALDPHSLESLYGQNTIYADTGDTSVTYRADPTLYISKKIAEAISALS